MSSEKCPKCNTTRNPSLSMCMNCLYNFGDIVETQSKITKVVCNNCEKIGYSVTNSKGDTIVEIILWGLSLLVLGGMFYVYDDIANLLNKISA